MTIYTADDVRAEYKAHPDVLSANLTDEQATMIASLWSKFKVSVLNFHDDDSITATFQFTNMAITAAHIIDGTLTVEELIEDEKKYIGALNCACGMTEAAIIASQEMGVDIAPILHQVRINRELAVELIKHYLPN